MSISENVMSIRARMESAARSAGRRPEDILLCAATKMNDAEAVRQAISAGVDVCGENRVQELVQKNAEAAYTGRPLHFIGRLQKNKVKQVVGVCDLIQSVDSEELLQFIDRIASGKGIVQNILLEVNIGAEESKAGFTVQQAEQMCQQASQYPHICIHGFMAIPPVSEHPGDNLHYFDEMHALYVDMQAKKYDNTLIDCLSMGMSDDFEDAIRAGSTMVRVGTAIFGARNYNH